MNYLRVGNIMTQFVPASAESPVVKDLRNYLSVKVQGYQFSKAYKQRRWDGTKCFMAYGKFPTGLLPLTCNFLEDEGYPFELVDMRENLPTFGEPQTQVGNYTLYDYQQEFVNRIVNSQYRGLAWPRGIIDAATNAGKSLIAAATFASVTGYRKGLFLLPTKDLYDQAVEYYRQFFDVGEIRSGVYNVREFTVAMLPTLYSMLQAEKDLSELHQVNFLIVDEAHRASAASFGRVINRIPAGCRIFISGTPLELNDKVKNLTIMSLSGPPLGKISNKELIERGVSRKPVIHLHQAQVDPDSVLIPKKREYQEETEVFIHACEARAAQVADIISLKVGKRCLVSFSSIAHGELLVAKLRQKMPNARIELTHGKTIERKELLEDFRQGKIDVLVASMILKEGINIPGLDLLFMAQGGISTVTLKQFIGRALRRKEGESEVEVHDFYDYGEYLEEHSKARCRLYKREGFEIVPTYELKDQRNMGYLPKKSCI